MTDVININSLKSNCDCHKNDPAPRCSCGQPSIPGDQFFKVKNYFSELKKEWQKAEARANLGITEIVDIKQTKFGEGSGDENVWTITFKKGDNTYTSEFKVLNGKDGAPATITLGEAFTSEIPVVINAGTPTNAILKFGIPKGERGERGEKGESGSKGLSAYEIYLANGGTLSEPDWLESLKGKPGKDGTEGSKITSISIVDYKENTTKYYLDNQSYTSDMFIWRIALDNNTSYDIWVPKGGITGPDITPRSQEFMYKKVHFNEYPTETELLTTLLSLQQEVNTNGHGKSINELRSLEWKSYAEAPGTNDFVFLATAPIENEEIGVWSVVRLTPRDGDKGDPGEPGTPGGGSEGKQGLSGPVIRMRGNWQSGQCYVNQSAQQPTDDTLRFIDVVYYLDTTNPQNTGYYKVRPTNSQCVTDVPTNGDVWEKAREFDFMFVDTLIAQYLSANYVDADEVRIHDRSSSGDKIVAGMTSGNAIGDEANDAGSVRIWAGTEVDILDEDQKVEGKWPLNIQDAPFKVHQNGHLFASDADIEGIVQANTLRLGVLNANLDGNGTYIQPTNTDTITLPELVDNRTQVFYLLTNILSKDDELTVQVHNMTNPTDSIKQQGTRIFTAKGQKLYQLFGINHVWYIIEQDVAPAYVVIDPDTLIYGRDYTVENPHFELNFGYNEGDAVAIEAFFRATVKNMTNYDILVVFPAMSFTLNVSIQVKADGQNDFVTKTGVITVKTSDVLVGVDPKGNQEYSSQAGYMHTMSDNTQAEGTAQGNLYWNWEGTPPTFTSIPETLTAQNFIGSINNQFLFNPFTSVTKNFNGENPDVEVNFTPSWTIGKKNQVNLLTASINNSGTNTSLISDFYASIQQNND